MEYDKNTYSSFDLMKIFGIKKGSWQSVKKKYNLDDHAENIFDQQQNQYKFLYNQEAYNILNDNYKEKVVEKAKENPQMLALISENTTLRATIEEYRNLSSKFEIMYQEEKEKKENLLIDNTNLSNANGIFIQKNHELEEQKHNLQSEKENLQEKNSELEKKLQDLKIENDRMKNRGLLARIFNK